MYILKNAVTSIIRNKGRNLLIGIIILVISSTTAITLAINNSSTSLIKSYQEKYEIEATLGVNREKMMENFNPEEMESSREKMQESFNLISNLSIEDIEKYGDSQYVKDYYYTMTVGINANDITKASQENESMQQDGPERVDGNLKENGGKRGFSNSTSGDFTLAGYSSIDAMNDFIEGTYKITDGEVPTDFTKDTCLINKELATMNNLNVDDKITLVDPLDDSKTLEVTIAGIYEETQSDDNKMAMFTNSANTIITNTTLVSKIKETNSDLSVETKPTFTLTDSTVIEKFEDELRQKNLSENLTVETNLNQLEEATKSISNVKTFAITFLIIILITGTIVLLIINMINIRERKYEIGVLRTIGMKKSKVALQFLEELLIIATIFLLIGAGIGACLSVPISNHLLENEITASKEESTNIENNFGHQRPDQNMPDNKGMGTEKRSFKGVSNIEAFESIDAVVNLKVLLELLGIGLIITLISCISAIITIERFSPLTILKERT